MTSEAGALPPDGLLLFEHRAVDPGERRGSYRFLVREDGTFLHQANGRDDGGAEWDAPLAVVPGIRLDPDALADLRAAISASDVGRGAPVSSGRSSNPVVQRFAVRTPEGATADGTYGRELPDAVARLRALVDELVERSREA